MKQINKNPNKANLDSGQMYNAVFDGENESFRVSVIDGLELKVENLSIPELKMPEIKEIKVPEIIRQVQIIEIPTIIKETITQTIEVPVVVKEIEFQIVEKPIYITEVKLVEIEKPVIVKETEIKVIEQKIYEMPVIAKVCMIVQAAALIGILLTKAL